MKEFNTKDDQHGKSEAQEKGNMKRVHTENMQYEKNAT